MCVFEKCLKAWTRQPGEPLFKWENVEFKEASNTIQMFTALICIKCEFCFNFHSIPVNKYHFLDKDQNYFQHIYIYRS